MSLELGDVLVNRVVDRHEDLDITHVRNFGCFFEKSFFSLKQGLQSLGAIIDLLEGDISDSTGCGSKLHLAILDGLLHKG